VREGLTGAFDTQNIVFWSELEQRYVLYFRTWSSGVAYHGEREIGRSTSPDLITWSSPERMTYGDAPLEELYTQQTQSYFRAPHLYVAFPNRFLPGRKVLSEDEFVAAGIWQRSRTSGVNDGVFMTSRGGTAYGKPLPGHTRDDQDLIVGDELARIRVLALAGNHPASPRQRRLCTRSLP